MNRARWMIEGSALGWPGVAGLVLFAVAALGQALLFALPPATTNPARPAAGASGAPASRLERFHRHFREAGPAQEQLATLHRIAASNGLALRQGEYRLLPAGEARLRPYQVTLPLTGSYPAVRRFLAAVLEELPAAALEQVTFERKRIGEAAVEAQVRLTFYLGDS